MLALQKTSPPPPQRVYAIGDVHGRLDLFKRLIRLIKQDSAGRVAMPTIIILLGNLVDYGPDSAALVNYCKQMSDRTDRFVVLKGDHEAMMGAALSTGDPATIQRWLCEGGKATLASWGMPARLLDRCADAKFLAAARRLIGEEVLGWMNALALSSRQGNHLLVSDEMGLRAPPEEPGLSRSSGAETAPLPSVADRNIVVVRSQGQSENSPGKRNRIFVGSSSHLIGRLSALGLEGKKFWHVVAEPEQFDLEAAAVRSKVDELVASLRRGE